MKKFESKSGLPEAIGSQYRPELHPKFQPRIMCGWRNCKSRRIGHEVLPGGEIVHTYAQGFGDIVIRTDDGVVHGHVCQACYIAHLTQCGLDQLSVAQKVEAERVAQPDLKMSTSTPRGLVDHLTQIERTVLQKSQDNANMERWRADLYEWQTMVDRDNALAEQYSERDDHDAH